MDRIVVFCPNLVGDAVMATPTLRALRKQFPDSRIVGAIKAPIAPTLAGNPWLDEVIAFQPKSKAKTADDRASALVRRMRRERFDAAILLPNSFRSALLAWLGGAKRRIGYARGGRTLLLTDRLQPPRDPQGRLAPVPAVNYYLTIARHLGCRDESSRLELFTTESDEAAADRAWRELDLPTDRPVVCLNTGGAFGPAKSWPVEHFAALARRLAEEDGLAVLAICGPSERDAVRRIAEQAGHPAVKSLADQPLSLGLSKACVKRSALLVTTDSGPRHFAAAFRVPVLTLFGPTHIAWSRTQHPQATHVFHPVPCGPCQRPVCPQGHHRCMRDLAPDQVLSAVRRMLRSPSMIG